MALTLNGNNISTNRLNSTNITREALNGTQVYPTGTPQKGRWVRIGSSSSFCQYYGGTFEGTECTNIGETTIVGDDNYQGCQVYECRL